MKDCLWWWTQIFFSRCRTFKRAHCTLAFITSLIFHVLYIFGILLETTCSTKGTEPYKAPEMLGLDRCKFSKATDIYAYGVLMWEITTQEKPQVREDPRTTCIARLWGQLTRPRYPYFPWLCDVTSTREFIYRWEKNQGPEIWKLQRPQKCIASSEVSDTKKIARKNPVRRCI